MRKRQEWKIASGVLQLGERTLIMGVLNVTPDSFSDGGRFDDPDLAYARALELEDQGADLIDIGAESTRPGSERVSEAEELRRLIPVLKRLKGKLGIPISVDTYKAAVAAKALEHGAAVINDPTGLTFEPDLAKVAATANAGLVLNHMRGTPETWAKLGPMKDPVETVRAELEAAAHRAVRSGVARESVVVDPGIGFGKRKEQNAELLANLGVLTSLPFPVLIGASRKSFLAQENEELTEFASAAAVVAAILGGAAIVRVHDVRAMRAAVMIADMILENRQGGETPLKKAAPLRGSLPGPKVSADEIEERRKRPIAPPGVLKKKPAADGPRSQEEWETRPPARKRASEDRPFYDRAPRRGRPEREEEPPPPRTRVYREKPPQVEGEERPRRFEDRGDRGPRRFDDRGDRPTRNYGDREDRPPRKFADRDDRPPRKFEDRGDRPQRSYGNREDRPPRKFDDRGDRPPRKFEDRGDRPTRSYGNREDRPPRKFDDRGDRPPRKFEDRGDRPPRRFGDEGGDRPARGGFKRSGPGGGTGSGFKGKPGGFKRSGPGGGTGSGFKGKPGGFKRSGPGGGTGSGFKGKPGGGFKGKPGGGFKGRGPKRDR